MILTGKHNPINTKMLIAKFLVMADVKDFLFCLLIFLNLKITSELKMMIIAFGTNKSIKKIVTIINIMFWYAGAKERHLEAITSDVLIK